MSKRLKKRQQREQEELDQLQAAQIVSAQEDAGIADDVEEEEAAPAAPVNAFAALGGDDEEEEEEEEEEDGAVPQTSATKKNKKKKPKKKKAVVEATEDTSASTPGAGTPGQAGRKKKGAAADPFAGLDEVDRALAELGIKPGESSSPGATTSADASGSSRPAVAFKNLLSVDPKNLDADAELRRFFGSKVIASSAQMGSKSHRPGPSAKLRYTISKPKPNYPPATSLAGLSMRELDEEETNRVYVERNMEGRDLGEKWFTFEHAGVWREIERQFMGAVRSHDPNELMALLQVYPWHVDTLLQMSEVYRLQSDIGAASDYAERALYAFDRCLSPAFSVSSGACRLDFDRVENRPMFTALHRIISYLGRRGCWSTAFNFAKLLFSLDPFGDPHGASFWLDFLAIKSGNGEWLISMLEQAPHSAAASVWHAYPGMAYAQALALRVDEKAKKHGDHSESDAALRDAIKTFPQVVVPLGDKIGADVPGSARSHKLLQVEAGYTDSPSNVIHLLSHIYVARSEALWKEADTLAWFQTQVPLAITEIDSAQARDLRNDVLARIQEARDPVDDSLGVPLRICRHVVCSESTSWLGFLPPVIRNKAVHAFDPLPPTTAISAYDNDYFAGAKSNGRSIRGVGGGPMEGFMERLMGAMQAGEGWEDRVAGLWRDLTGRREFANVPEEERAILLQQLMQLGNDVAGAPPEAREGRGGMPGGFPGQEDE